MLFIAALVNNSQMIRTEFAHEEHSIVTKLKISAEKNRFGEFTDLPADCIIKNKPKKFTLSDKQRELLGINVDFGWKFFRLVKGEQLYCGQQYSFSRKEDAKRCSHYIKARYPQHGDETRVIVAMLNYFLAIRTNNEYCYFASIFKCETMTDEESGQRKLTNIRANEKLITIGRLLSLLVCVEVNSGHYLLDLVHTKEY